MNSSEQQITAAATASENSSQATVLDDKQQADYFRSYDYRL